jgi:solute carrier family 13 (sodium-dependent dicarboxylate transporter), member 2/3/5
MAGLMIVTAFLSMWINNSAAASIMLPVALAICNELKQHSSKTREQQVSTIGKPKSLTSL